MQQWAVLELHAVVGRNTREGVGDHDRAVLEVDHVLFGELSKRRLWVKPEMSPLGVKPADRWGGSCVEKRLEDASVQGPSLGGELVLGLGDKIQARLPGGPHEVT